ncbi:uncharacterized protein LOC122650826 [Telopea speciosissima]|uniref:uncharacterized protein LOC122650826 n=1 Tax=Telopea speciosissima TaxID=54955 RepID=UPI001CC817E8|nr:uncharacterized protein LOC122650826 [Telopea speciosissima]
MALRESKPGDLTDASTNAERVKMKKWVTTNLKCILVIKKSIPKSLRDSVEVKDTATEFLSEIKAVFEVSQKTEKGDLMNQITSAVFDGTESVKEHLLKMASTVNKLRDLGMPIEEELLVHLALKSLPDVYANIKSINAAQKDKWTMKELISICAQEKGNMKKMTIESANLTENKGTFGSGTKKGNLRFFKKGKYHLYNKERRSVGEISCYW